MCSCRVLALLAPLAAACRIADSGPPARGDTTAAALVESRVPEAAAGDTGWPWVRRATLDLNGDARPEQVVVLSDVRIDSAGRPLWEDGHRWQVYVESPAGERTRLYARFLPNGSLATRFTEPARGAPPRIVLLERTPSAVGVYDVRYVSPGSVLLESRLTRQLSVQHTLEGAPEP
jgi:hypothetical protein